MKRLSLLALTIMLSAAAAYAGLTVTPSRTEAVMNPGDSGRGKYTVRNDYTTPVDITVEARDWFVLPENKDITVRDWLKLYPVEFRLLPGESRDVEYDVTLPKTAQGTLVGMVSFIPQTPDESGVTLVVSVSMYVTARGTEKPGWDIESVKMDGSAEKWQVLADVKNTGNIHLRPTGNVLVMSGDTVVRNTPILEGRPVYPGATRAFIAREAGSVPLAPGKYTAVVKMTGNGLSKESTLPFEVSKTGEIKTK